jgi:hypothetical protein
MVSQSSEATHCATILLTPSRAALDERERHQPERDRQSRLERHQADRPGIRRGHHLRRMGGLAKRESACQTGQGLVTVRTIGKKADDGTQFMSFERTALIAKRGHGIED